MNTEFRNCNPDDISCSVITTLVRVRVHLGMRNWVVLVENDSKLRRFNDPCEGRMEDV